MSDRLVDDPDAVAVLAANVAGQTGVPASHVEKDFWVTEVLRGVAEAAKTGEVELVFKGGTSLSKAFSRLNFGLNPFDLYLPHSSMPWNPNVLAAFCRRGIVEQLGSGTLRMIRLCIEAGLGALVFTSNAASVTCSIPRTGCWLGPDGRRIVLSDDEAVLMAALAKGAATRGELAESAGLPSLGVRDAMNRLRRHGLVHSEGHVRGAKWVMEPG